MFTYQFAFAFLNKIKMLVAQKGKHVQKTLQEKCQALKDIEEGLPNKDVAIKYGVPKNTISTWIKNKDKILSSLEKGQNVIRRKLCAGAHEALDAPVFKWFLNMRSQKVSLSGGIIQEKASIYAKELNTENFKASNGWLRRWKERRNITFKTISGESNSVTSEMVNAWKETSLPTLLSNYELKDIYNADEFGLFYKCVINKTYQLKSEKCSGRKLSKIRITWMAATNAAGDKIPMFVIGKSQKSRRFKNVKFLPCQYRNQKKSWMDGALFEEWVRVLDRKFESEGRSIALVIVNCPAHPHIENLKSIKLFFFLPPNTTSATQPVNQGVIRSLKAKYRKNMVRKIIRNLEKNKALLAISILNGIQILVSTWNSVSIETIVNCFCKAGISPANQEAAIAEEDDPFKDLQDEIHVLRNVQPDLVPEDVNASSLIDVDSEVSTVQPPLTDSEILAEFFKTGDISDGEIIDASDDIEEEPVEYPGETDLLNALELLQKFSLFSANCEAVQVNCLNRERSIDNYFMKRIKQTRIKDYFKL